MMVPGGKSGCGGVIGLWLAILLGGILGVALFMPSSVTVSSARPAGYVDSNQIPTLGDPAAPIHFIVVSDFACPHCQNYYKTDMQRFINDYVQTGQASFGIALVTFVGRDSSVTASQAALCANDQGFFWEMDQELYQAAMTMPITEAFSLEQILTSAKTLGLDQARLRECVSSGQYATTLNGFMQFSQDQGVTGVPTVLVSYRDSGTWAQVPRDYDSLKNLVEAAHKPQ